MNELNWGLALPEIVLACAGMAVLIFGVLRDQDSFKWCSGLVLGAFGLTAVLVIGTDSGSGYNGVFTVDAFARFAKILILAGSALTLILSLDYNPRHHIARFEFPVLMLFCTIGMMTMASATDLMTLYIGVELQSLCLYVLAAFARDDLRSSEAGLKYFVLSALASGLLLYGMSLTYGFSGSTHFDAIATAVGGSGHENLGLMTGIAFMIAGLAFKLSAVPFHMWTPDVYEGSPTAVTAFMSTAPKVAPFAVLLRLMMGPFGQVSSAWQMVIIFISVASMLLGSISAIRQTNIKRLIAYSSIANMGYALIGLAAASPEGVRGVLIFLLSYVAMSAGAFACIIAMRRKNVAVESIYDLAGLARSDLSLAVLFAIFLFSMAGIPPMVGFFGKLFVFQAAIAAQLYTLAIIGVLTSVIGCYYYIRVVKIMFFDAPLLGKEDGFDDRAPSLNFVAYACGVFTLGFFVFPAPFVGAAEAAAKALFG